MKKCFTTNEYKLKNKIRSLISIKRKKRRKNKVYVINRPKKNRPKKNKYLHIYAPEVFSIVTNLEEVKVFIEDIKSNILKGRAVYINMDKVQNVSLDAIIYTIAFFDEIRENKIKYKINGSFPKDGKAKKLIIESGFLKYIYPDANINIQTDIFTIKEGFKVDSIIATEVSKYLRNKLNVDRSNTKPIRTIIIESMANTYNHAFIKGEQKVTNKWYLSAFYFENEVHFVFLDNGSGIAETMKKKFFFDLIKSDAELIMSALNGTELRSQTGEKKRGKGLPKIFEKAKDINISELILMANKGLINAKNGTFEKLNVNFEGTLLSWKIVNEEVFYEKDN